MKKPTDAPLITSLHICSVAELAAALRIDPSTLHDWLATDVRLRGCLVHVSRKKLWFSVEKLMQVGVLQRPAQPTVVAMPALTASWSIAQ